MQLPGFARGLAFANGLAFIGLSRPRPEAEAPSVPVASRFEEHFSGIWVVDPEHGTVAAYLRFQAQVAELSDLAALTGKRSPEVLAASDEAATQAFNLPTSPPGGRTRNG